MCLFLPRTHTQGQILIADSWFGSVSACLHLLNVKIFSVMNVKTGCSGYPKDAMLKEVGEIKGASTAAKAQRAQRRGKQIAFTKAFTLGRDTVTLVAGGHNKKVPLLLIASASSMLPGNTHVKRWTTTSAQGIEAVHELKPRSLACMRCTGST
mmetsp:Transcript_68732/g.136170  ORF Transcript_68732/g.136170 Transcript_68732/m.136170 type:complete len:153 (-) Transcript_68732:696-1154(-)